MNELLIGLVAVVLVSGCGRPTESDATPPAETNATDVANTLIDHATGRTQVRTYKRVRTKINDINQKRNEDIKRMLE